MTRLLAAGHDVLGPGLWLVGDSFFPGQGTMATVLSAIRVVERITGLSWGEFHRRGRRGRGEEAEGRMEYVENFKCEISN